MTTDRVSRQSGDPAEAPPRRDADPVELQPIDAAVEPQLERERAAWAREKEILQAMLAQQQRVAQAGLITSSLAHDIRNQVQMMMSTAELSLISDGESGLKQALRDITDFCRDVSETTEAFLAFARRQSAMDSRRFALTDVVEHCRRLVAPLAQSNGVELRCAVSDDGFVQGEQRLAIQALVNLATNAVKACAGQAKGEVTITASRPRPEICRLTVADTGPGVPESVRARLFRPLVGTRSSKGGNGLGLFIVRQAVLDLGGKITVKTSPMGSIFRVDLPSVDATGNTTGPITATLVDPI